MINLALYLPRSISVDFQVVSKEINNIVSGVAIFFFKALKIVEKTGTQTCHIFAKIPKETGRFSSVVRKLEKFVLPYFAVCLSKFECFKAVAYIGSIKESCNDLADVVELARIVIPINYFYNSDYKKDSHEQVRGQIASLAADVAGIPLFLDEVKLIDLGKIAEKVGNLRFFGAITSIPLGSVAFCAATVAHGFFAIDSYNELQKTVTAQATQPVGENEIMKLSKFKNRTYASLNDDELARGKLDVEKDRLAKVYDKELSFYANCAELVVDGLLIAGVTSLPGLAVAGGACVALSVASMVNEK